MTTETIVRGSAKSERERLVTRISDIEGQLESVERRSVVAADPSYQRSEARLRVELLKARDRLRQFDDAQAVLAEARGSSESAKAQAAAKGAASKVESKLSDLCTAISELKAAAGELAAAQQCHDPNLWPSPQAVDVALRAFVTEQLGSCGVKFDGFGSASKPARPLSDRF